jgi:hypothetical protein
MDKLKSALAYLARGFSLIPCRPDKKPYLKTWAEFQTRRPERAEVEGWWKKWPVANVGLVTGPISDLTVVDCDSAEAWAWVQSHLPDSLQAPVVVTPTGNRQIYFRHLPGLHSQNGVRLDLDIKTDGGYVLCPPSVCEYTKKGKRIRGEHRWQAGEKCGIGEMPEALATELARAQREPSRVRNIIDENNNGDLGGVEDACPPLSTESTHVHVVHELFVEGRRDNDLFHAANCLIKGGCESESARQILEILAKNCNPPFPPSEINSKVQSALNRKDTRSRTYRNREAGTRLERERTILYYNNMYDQRSCRAFAGPGARQKAAPALGGSGLGPQTDNQRHKTSLLISGTGGANGKDPSHSVARHGWCVAPLSVAMRTMW